MTLSRNKARGTAVEWRPVAGDYPYEISSAGFVRTEGGRSPRSLFTKENGYQQVTLFSRHNNGKTFLVHRLVLETFVGPCPDGMQAGHLNGDPADNRLANLRWVTPAENGRHRIEHGTQVHGVDVWSAVLTPAKVRAIRVLREAGMSGRDVGEVVGCDPATVSHVMVGRRWTRVA